MNEIGHRPFYTAFAWAYDLVITGPVSSRCDFVEAALSQRGILPGCRVLDAGCGTGSYAIELARRKYEVTGLDASKELIAEASSKSAHALLPLSFRVGDVLRLPATDQFDGILCRGVLNDLVDDADRQQVFFSFARALRQGGVLILDVREWHATASRKTQEPIFSKSVETERGKLIFCSRSRVDAATRRLFVTERHSLEKGGVETVWDYDFTMRCWTQEELDNCLTNAGFGSIAYFGDYDPNRSPGATDRLVAVASLEGKERNVS